MKIASIIILLGTAIGVVYGVIFTNTYTLVDITYSISLLFAVCGLLTSAAIVGLAKLCGVGKTPPQQTPSGQQGRAKRRAKKQ